MYSNIVADVFFVEEGMSYLGTQGDVWDAQKDMAVAFLGVLLAAVLYYLNQSFNQQKSNAK